MVNFGHVVPEICKWTDKEMFITVLCCSLIGGRVNIPKGRPGIIFKNYQLKAQLTASTVWKFLLSFFPVVHCKMCGILYSALCSSNFLPLFLVLQKCKRPRLDSVSFSTQTDIHTCTNKQLVEVFSRVICSHPKRVPVCLKSDWFVRLGHVMEIWYNCCCCMTWVSTVYFVGWLKFCHVISIIIESLTIDPPYCKED